MLDHNTSVHQIMADVSHPSTKPEKPLLAYGELTPRQGDIVREIVTGKTNPEIAKSLGIATHTVADCLKTIFTKTNVRSRSELAISYYGPSEPWQFETAVKESKLTRRETQVLAHALKGEPIKRIAQQTHISAHTAQGAMKTIFKKMDLHSHASLYKKIHDLQAQSDDFLIDLTRPEKTVAGHLLCGTSLNDIATELSLSRKEAELYQQAIFFKLEVKDVGQMQSQYFGVPDRHDVDIFADHHNLDTDEHNALCLVLKDRKNEDETFKRAVSSICQKANLQNIGEVFPLVHGARFFYPQSAPSVPAMDIVPRIQ